MFLWFLFIWRLSQDVYKFILCSFCFKSLGRHPMFCLNFNHLFFVPWVFRLWDVIISQRFYLSLVVNYFGFSSLGHNPRSSLSFFFVPLVSHHHPIYSLFIQFLIIRTPSQVLCKLNYLFLWFLFIGRQRFFLHLVSHHWGTILGSILVYSLFFFFWFFIIWTLSYVLSQFLLCYFCFSSLGHHHRFDLSLFFVSFGFSFVGHYPRFYLSSIVGSFGFSLSLG